MDEFIYVLTLFESPTISVYARFLERDYPGAVQKKFGELASVSDAEGGTEPVSAKIGMAEVDRMETCLVALSDQISASTNRTRNLPAIFILAPPVQVQPCCV